MMMVMITTATVVGNGAVMVALSRVRRAPSHYPLLSLVSADLLVGILVQPLAAMRELYVFKLNRVFCSCWSILDVLCCTASILSLCVLGFERWSGITAPLARARRVKRAKVFAGLVWPVAVLIAVPNAFMRSPRHFHPGELEKACVVNTNTGYVFFSVTLSFYLPAIVMFTLYGFILRALSAPPPVRAHRGRVEYISQRDCATKSVCKNGRRVTTDDNQNNVNVSPRGCLNLPPTIIECVAPTTEQIAHENFICRQRRATRIIVMLMALFLVCWTPYFVMLPIDSVYNCVYDTAWWWCTWLGYINSALNPLVYAAASPSVRSALRSSFTSGRNEIALASRRR